ncbi:glutathione S-transferase [Blakeslea trispora]|nr:glutathione S-transferase [Blakeslea trispora]
MTNKFILYSNEVCPFGHRVRIAFAELGIQYEQVEVDLINMPEWYKEIDPVENVPCLSVDGNVLTESMVILEYLVDCFPEKHLMPKDPLKRAEVRLGIDYFFNKVALPYFGFFTNSKAKNARDMYEEAISKAFVGFESVLKKQSSNGPYFLGNEFSVADIAIAPFLARILATNKYMGYSMNVVKESPRLEEFIRGNISRPSVEKTWCGDDTLIRFAKEKYGFQI